MTAYIKFSDNGMTFSVAESLEGPWKIFVYTSRMKKNRSMEKLKKMFKKRNVKINYI